MPLELHTIFQGEVAVLHNYGAFVTIPGKHRIQGLVHKSQISSARVDNAREVLEVNEKVWCKIISISDDNKIGLSMKVVDQGNGQDLDPNNVKISLDVQQRRKQLVRSESSRITLEAILKTKCSKCGVTGHIAKNCFQTPKGKTYELIPEPEPEKKIFGTIQDRMRRLADAGIKESSSSTDKKKKKKEKKTKKRKRSSSDDDSASDESPRKKSKHSHRKGKKKHKKHKK